MGEQNRKKANKKADKEKKKELARKKKALEALDAAQLFESMIPSQEDVVISILENLTPEGRAAILSNMSTASY